MKSITNPHNKHLLTMIFSKNFEQFIGEEKSRLGAVFYTKYPIQEIYEGL